MKCKLNLAENKQNISADNRFHIVMNRIHMGKLLEEAVKKNAISITEIANKLEVSRRTMYNWFKQEKIDDVTLQRISSIMLLDTHNTKMSLENTFKGKRSQEGSHWQDKYIALLERYSEMLASLKTN